MEAKESADLCVGGTILAMKNLTVKQSSLE